MSDELVVPVTLGILTVVGIFATYLMIRVAGDQYAMRKGYIWPVAGFLGLWSLTLGFAGELLHATLTKSELEQVLMWVVRIGSVLTVGSMVIAWRVRKVPAVLALFACFILTLSAWVWSELL